MTRYNLITAKRYIEQILMLPFVIVGKMAALIRPLKNEYDFFMFFPTYALGGAEKINGDVVAALPDQRIIIFFTRHANDATLLHLFQKPNVTIKKIEKWTDNKFMYWNNIIYRGVCAYYINSQKKPPVIFNGQCNFAYKLFPHINKNILKVELIHMANLSFAKVTFPYIPFIDTRVMIIGTVIKQHITFYKNLCIPQKFEERIVKITNSCYIPEVYTQKTKNKKLKVYYAGRGGYQKHLELLFAIIKKCLDNELSMEFHLAGSFEDEIPQELKEHVLWHGNISSREDIYKLHQEMDVLLMTSRYEGFPLAIMEAMACGVAIIATAVDGIPEHITDGVNGFLMHSVNDEQIIEDGISFLKTLEGNRQLLETISFSNYEYAKTHFSKGVFDNAYRRVFRLQELN